MKSVRLYLLSCALCAALASFISCGGGSSNPGPPPPPPPGPPGVPSLQSPANNASLAAGTTSTNVQWNAVSDATNYDVAVFTGSCGGTAFVAGNSATTSFAVSNLSNGQTYFWQARSNNANGSSAFSGCFSFSISGTAPPPAPKLTNPANEFGFPSGTTSATLQWSAVSGATSYDVQAFTVSCGGTAFPGGGNTASTSLTLSNLSVGTIYFWQVRTNTTSGTSAFSSCFAFSVAKAPGSPPPNAVQVSLDTTQKFQVWESWRGVPSGPFFLNQNGVNATVSKTEMDSILNDLVNDVGITGVRYEFHQAQKFGLASCNPDAFTLSSWSCFPFSNTYTPPGTGEPLVNPVAKVQQVIYPMQQLVAANGDPFSLYASQVFQKSQMPAYWLTPVNGQDEWYAQFAQAGVLWLQNRSPSPISGVPQDVLAPKRWVLVNEPDANGFSAADLVPMATATGNRFKNVMKIATTLQVAETETPNASLLSGVLNQSVGGNTVNQYVGMISFHGYDYNSSLTPTSFVSRNAMRTAAQGLGVPTAMSEICCHPGWGGANGADYPTALGWARDIYWNMTQANISDWEPNSLMFTCRDVGCSTPNETVVSIDLNLTTHYKKPVYYGLRQFAHYIRPNHQRVAFTCIANCPTNTPSGEVVKPVAFLTPSGKIVVVVMNDQSSLQAISLVNLPAGTYSITGVDPSHSTSPVVYAAQAISAGQAVWLNFPAQSILTFVQQ